MKKKGGGGQGLTPELAERLREDGYCFDVDHERVIDDLRHELKKKDDAFSLRLKEMEEAHQNELNAKKEEVYELEVKMKEKLEELKRQTDFVVKNQDLKAFRVLMDLRHMDLTARQIAVLGDFLLRHKDDVGITSYSKFPFYYPIHLDRAVKFVVDCSKEMDSMRDSGVGSDDVWKWFRKKAREFDPYKK